MDSQFQSKLFRRAKYPTRLFDIEIAALAKYVAKFGKTVRSHSRKHLVNDEIDVFVSTPFARHCVCAEERRHNFQRRLLIEASHHTQHLQSIFVSQTVARF